jgi:hypothetical protein
VTEIIAEVDTRNAASYKLLERLSFERVMMKEQADFFKGRYSDEYVYRLTCQPSIRPGYSRQDHHWLDSRMIKRVGKRTSSWGKQSVWKYSSSNSAARRPIS